MGRLGAGADIDDVVRALDDWVAQSAQATRVVEQQAEVERKGPTTDDGRSRR